MSSSPNLPKQSLIGELMSAPMRPGRVIWIGLRSGRRAAIVETPVADLVAGKGVAGDRYLTSTNGARQVTLIAQEDISAIAAFLGLERVAPSLLRRNLVTAGINLLALKHRRFRIGTAILETSGECAPCSHMEETLGPGGYNAMRGRGGITARIIEGSPISIGDPIAPIPPQ